MRPLGNSSGLNVAPTSPDSRHGTRTHGRKRAPSATLPKTSRPIRATNRKLKALGASPISQPSREQLDQLSPQVDEYQIAMSTYQSEDLAQSISLFGLSFALFALFLSTLSGLGVLAGLIVCLIGLLYFTTVGLAVVTGRRTAAAAAAVIAFRGAAGTQHRADVAPRPSPAPRFALLNVTVGSADRPHCMRHESVRRNIRTYRPEEVR